MAINDSFLSRQEEALSVRLFDKRLSFLPKHDKRHDHSDNEGMNFTNSMSLISFLGPL